MKRKFLLIGAILFVFNCPGAMRQRPPSGVAQCLNEVCKYGGILYSVAGAASAGYYHSMNQCPLQPCAAYLAMIVVGGVLAYGGHIASRDSIAR